MIVRASTRKNSSEPTLDSAPNRRIGTASKANVRKEWEVFFAPCFLTYQRLTMCKVQLSAFMNSDIILFVACALLFLLIVIANKFGYPNDYL